VDFDCLNRELNTAHECVVRDCVNHVPALNAMCPECFIGSRSEEVVFKEGTKTYEWEEARCPAKATVSRSARTVGTWADTLSTPRTAQSER